MNPMQQVRIEKVTLNIGAGKEQTKLEKGMALIEQLTGIKPVKTVTNKRIAGWGLRPGLPIGCKLTLRRKKAAALLPRLLKAKENVLREHQFDSQGNLSFGIPEYIDIDGARYEPKIGVMGLEVCVTLEKPGYRVKRRKFRKGRISKKHLVTKEEAISFLRQQFNTRVEGREDGKK